MKILLVGSGGREHAIAWKLAQNSKVEKIYCAPGNGGTALEDKCENVKISGNENLLQFAKENNIDLTVVGPENPLCEGIVDLFKESNLKIFGPDKKAAMLEGSKSFSKDFMKKYGVKTAEYGVFSNKEEAIKYVENCEIPVVIKADGLAAGKGVVICESKEEAISTLEDFMSKDIFKGAGQRVVIEEFLEGVEASILSITDGKVVLPFVSSKDHKQIFDGNKGANTGGMGTIAPNPYCTEEVLKAFEADIMKPTLKGIQEEDMDFKGIIFFGLMICKKGVYLLEYNVRMGDPETEVVLPLMESDFLELIEAAIEENLSSKEVKFKNASACCIIAASKGYPGSYEVGFEITGTETATGKVFSAGTELKEGKLLTKGGRVLGVTSIGESLEEARNCAYKNIESIDFEGIYYRKDIGEIK
ncbi:phosphoribosylamine--glycine ligase [Clostridium collagenovorans DSM 3089]|uniref:Phosphoribosylamine--glycine ligase n=1 Tax=Clostridium collagenovorans DSM 3089 TaxID=1121306 RepID=A0A1M5SCT9_9CLOT|nr:phosphoribosylamine--glycine ligase [Clostridium collagenovorans]SHH36326.1 phosphoribosylamine--glycine ligase [Clostridium collagenovorans DSM 3089]